MADIISNRVETDLTAYINGLPTPKYQNLDTPDIWQRILQNSVFSISSDKTLTDSDFSGVYNVTTGSSTITITLPTAADNIGKKFIVDKIDIGGGKVTIAKEAGDGLYNQDRSFTTFEIIDRYIRIQLESDGTNWIKTNPPQLYMIPTDDRYNGNLINGTNPGTSFTSVDWSAYCPSGTLGLIASFTINKASTGQGILLVRDYMDGSESNSYSCVAVRTYAAGTNADSTHGVGSVATISAKNGKFEYADVTGGAGLASLYASPQGYII